MIQRSHEEIADYLLGIQESVKTIRCLHPAIGDMTIETAAEIIKELQAELDKAKEENKRLVDGIDVVNNEGVRLRRENTRLREALEEIVATRFSPSRYQGAVIAEQALKGE